MAGDDVPLGGGDVEVLSTPNGLSTISLQDDKETHIEPLNRYLFYDSDRVELEKIDTSTSDGAGKNSDLQRMGWHHVETSNIGFSVWVREKPQD